MKYIAGIDIGGTKCAVVIAKISGGGGGFGGSIEISIIDKLSFPTETEKGFACSRDRIFEALTTLLNRNGLLARGGEAQGSDAQGSDAWGGDRRCIEAIGVSCGGPLDSEKGIILSPPNLPGWDNIPFTEMLYDRFGIPAYLQNDANACALAEWRLGTGKGSKNMIFLTMGTGMGAGIISNGILIEGANGMAGEAGHMRISKDGPLGYGKNGSFEGYCGGGGIQLLALEMTEQWARRGMTPAWMRDGYSGQDVTAKLIADYAEAGDCQAIEIYDIVGKKLGEGLSVLVDILNPERIVLGSIFSRSGHLLRGAMEEALGAEALPRSLSALRVVPAALGDSIGDYASVMAACYRLGISVAASDSWNCEGSIIVGSGGVGDGGCWGHNHPGAGAPPLLGGEWLRAACGGGGNGELAIAPYGGGARGGGDGCNGNAGGDEGDCDVINIFESLFATYPGLVCCRDAIFNAYLIMRDTFICGKKLLVCGNGGSAADAGHIVGELMKGFYKKRPLPEQIQRAIKLQFDNYNETCLQKFGNNETDPFQYDCNNANYQNSEPQCVPSARNDRLDDPSKLLQSALPAIDLTQHQALSTAFANDVSPKYVFAQQVQGYGVRGDALLAISTSGNAENCCAAALVAKAKNMIVISLTGPGGGSLANIADCAIKTPGDSTARVQEYHLPVYHTLCAMLEEKIYK